jgi:ABC-2 type transport system ATP-binding protein
MSEYALEVRGLGKAWPGFALEDVSLALPRGYVMGLVGSNGAGKTTIIKLVMNLVSRTARRDPGVRPRQPDPRGGGEVAHRVRVRRVRFGPFYPSWSEERYRALLAEFGVPPAKGFRKLSGGTQMKLSLALALSHDADLLLLDEPTAGLDPDFRRELLGHLSSVGCATASRRTASSSTGATNPTRGAWRRPRGSRRRST